MFKISNIISMPVISLYEGNCIGFIYNITFDYKQKKCKYACVLNENDNITCLINCKDIYSIGKDCIFVKNIECLQLKESCEQELNQCNNPINLKCYNMNGDLLGTVIDIKIDKNYSISTIILDNNKEINSNNIINIGNLFLISNNKIKLSKFKPTYCLDKIITQSTQNKVSILGTNEENNNNSNKIITDYRFLVGRILTCDIKAVNGEIIAKNGTIINKNIINKASLYGKLVEIARHSKKARQNV